MFLSTNILPLWWLKHTTSVMPSKLYLLDRVMSLSYFPIVLIHSTSPVIHRKRTVNAVKWLVWYWWLARERHSADTISKEIHWMVLSWVVKKTWFGGSFYLLIYARTSGNTKVIGRTTNHLNNLGPVSEDPDYSLHLKTFLEKKSSNRNNDISAC